MKFLGAIISLSVDMTDVFTGPLAMRMTEAVGTVLSRPAVGKVALLALKKPITLTSERVQLSVERQMQQMLCCVNGGEGAGYRARQRYRVKARAYNRNRRRTIFAPFFKPVPPQPPLPGKLIERMPYPEDE